MQQTVNQYPDACAIISSGGQIVVLNEMFSQMFGYEKKELLNANVDCLVPDDVREAHAGHRKKFSEQPRVRHFMEVMTLRGRKKDGNTFPVDVYLSPLPNGFVVAVVRTGADMNDLYKKLCSLNEKASQLVQNIQLPDAK